MKKIKLIVIGIFATVVMTSCSESSEVVLDPVVSETATNIYAPVTTDYTISPPSESGEFTRFSFATGTIVTDNSWDIAFRGTTIIVNGGSAVGFSDEPTRTGDAALALLTGTFASVTAAPEDSEFKQDALETPALTTGSGNGWYTYNGQTNEISPIAGKVLVIKTNDGHYAKFEILSYYKDNDSSAYENARYYTFNYSYNPNVGDKSFEE